MARTVLGRTKLVHHGSTHVHALHVLVSHLANRQTGRRRSQDRHRCDEPEPERTNETEAGGLDGAAESTGGAQAEEALEGVVAWARSARAEWARSLGSSGGEMG